MGSPEKTVCSFETPIYICSLDGSSTEISRGAHFFFLSEAIFISGPIFSFEKKGSHSQHTQNLPSPQLSFSISPPQTHVSPHIFFSSFPLSSDLNRVLALHFPLRFAVSSLLALVPSRRPLLLSRFNFFFSFNNSYG